MKPELRVVFFGDLSSAWSRLHYRVLKKHTRVELWVELQGSNQPQRRTFSSPNDWWQRIGMRAALEWQCMIRLKIPLLLQSNTRAPVLFVSRDNSYGLEAIRALQPDIIVAAGFQRILPKEILQTARLGAYNTHPSPLPRYAGADPWFWMLRNGETQSAVTLHRMAPNVDAGNIVAQRYFSIKPSLNHRAFFNRSLLESSLLLKDCIDRWSSGRFEETPQDLAQRSLFRAPREADYKIDWTQSAQQVHNLIRASAPSPGAWMATRVGRLMVRKVERVPTCNGTRPGSIMSINGKGVCIACRDGGVRLVSVVRNGKEIRGSQIGTCLGLSLGEEIETNR